MANTKHYKERDIESLGNYYSQHIGAMTTEELYDKSDIAAELAHRDYEIDQLRKQLDSINELHDDLINQLAGNQLASTEQLRQLYSNYQDNVQSGYTMSAAHCAHSLARYVPTLLNKLELVHKALHKARENKG